MTSLPEGRSGRVLALLLTLLVPTSLWLGVAVPLMDWHADRAEALAGRAMLLAKMESLVASLPTLQRQSELETGGAGASLLDADNDPAASAALQERLQAMALQVGATLNSVETLPGEDAGAYRRIRLRVSFNAGWPVLLALLRDVGTAQLALLVDDLQIQPAMHRISTVPGSFDVACTVLALRTVTQRTAAR